LKSERYQESQSLPISSAEEVLSNTPKVTFR